MKRTLRDAAIIAIAMVIYTFGVVLVRAEPQTRLYDARGNSLGTATPQGDGSLRYYDSRGSSLGTSTTTPGGSAGPTTKFYDARGNVTGSTSSPAPFPGRR
jgi:hypothetical protein